jgi:hypothetical protein
LTKTNSLRRHCPRGQRAGEARQPSADPLQHRRAGNGGRRHGAGRDCPRHQEGNVSNVWVDETRPLLQGGRLTAWELGELGVPYQLITDSMAASLMAKGQVDAVWVGQIALPLTATWRTRSAPIPGGAGEIPRHSVLRGRAANDPRPGLPERGRDPD